MARRVLLLAYACDPSRGSEPGAGAVLARCAAELADEVVVITRKEPGFSASGLAASLGANVTVKQVGWGARGARLPTYVRYTAWIFAAARLARRLRKQEPFDVLHHGTYASDWFLNPLLFLRKQRGERWVWGPAGGASYAPYRVSRLVTQSRASNELVRRAATSPIRSVVQRALRARTDVALAMNEDTRRAFVKVGYRAVKVASNLVFDYDALPEPSPAPPQPTLVYASRGVTWKGLPLLLRAVGMLPDDWKVVIAGPDTDTARYRQLVPENAADRVEFVGPLTHDRTLDLIATASVLALPSLHDSGGWVAGEAAALGVPVACLDLGGVSAMAGSMAIAVPPTPVESLPERFVAAVVGAVGLPRVSERNHTAETLVETLRAAY